MELIVSCTFCFYFLFKARRRWLHGNFFLFRFFCRLCQIAAFLQFFLHTPGVLFGFLFLLLSSTLFFGAKLVGKKNLINYYFPQFFFPLTQKIFVCSFSSACVVMPHHCQLGICDTWYMQKMNVVKTKENLRLSIFSKGLVSLVNF